MITKALLKAREMAVQSRAAHASKDYGAPRKGVLCAKREDQATSADLYIYSAIGASFWSDGISANDVVAALNSAKGVKTLNVYINSEGGDVFEGKAIYSCLSRFDAEKIVHVDGLAASAASFIAMAGDKIISSPSATWMVHEAWGLAGGNASDLRAMADVLDMENKAIAGIYAARIGKTVDECLALMSAETWMDAAKAKELGFSDETSGESDADAEDPKAAAEIAPAMKIAALTQERIRAARQTSLEEQAKQLAAMTKTTRASPGSDTRGQPAARK